MRLYVIQRLDESDEDTIDAVILNQQAYSSEKRAMQEAEADAIERWEYLRTDERFPGVNWKEGTGVLQLTDDFQVTYTIVPVELV